MNRFTKLSAVAAAAILSTTAFAGTSLDANAEFDTGYASGNGTTPANKGTFQGGRIEINFAGKAEMNGGFVAGRGTVIASNAGNNAGVDDAWVQAGTSAVDVKLGRFEAADLYPTPGDVFRFGANFYTANTLRGRTTYAGAAGTNDRLHMALTANLAPGVALEVGLVDKNSVATVNGGGSKGIRPAVSFSAGPVAAKLGFETGKTADVTGEASFTGFAATAAVGVGGGLTVRANLASKTTKLAAGDQKSNGYLLGVDFANVNVNVESGKVGAAKSTGLFAAVALPLLGVKGATFQPAIGSYKDTTGAGVKTTVTKVGARVHYDF